MFGRVDFRKDGKKMRGNGRERNLLRCLVKRANERDFGGALVFSLWAHQIAISPKGEKRQAKMGAKKERHKYP